jgi:hypothetical protein
MNKLAPCLNRAAWVSGATSTAKEAKRIQTKKWAKDNCKHFEHFCERFGTEGVDKVAALKQALTSNYGFNIGPQLGTALTDEQLLAVGWQLYKAYFN